MSFYAMLVWRNVGMTSVQCFSNNEWLLIYTFSLQLIEKHSLRPRHNVQASTLKHLSNAFRDILADARSRQRKQEVFPLKAEKIQNIIIIIIIILYRNA